MRTWESLLDGNVADRVSLQQCVSELIYMHPYALALTNASVNWSDDLLH